MHGVRNLGRFPPREAASRQPARAQTPEHGGRLRTHARTTGSSVSPGVALWEASLATRWLWARTWTSMLFGYDKERRRSQHDLCGISVPKAAAAGPGPGDGVRGGGRGRPHRAAARQSYLVVPLAQRVAAPAATRPLHRPRPDRHWRLPQTARQLPPLVSL